MKQQKTTVTPRINNKSPITSTESSASNVNIFSVIFFSLFVPQTLLLKN
uniref:Uncharacterized protein n=1 Tax=Tetranychus urticae TaxID=32264 RepID=T1JR01_TETUR